MKTGFYLYANTDRPNNFFVILTVSNKVNESTSRSDFSQLLTVVSYYFRMRWIPRALHYTAYSSVWREEEAFFVEHLAVFFPPFAPSTFLCLSV